MQIAERKNPHTVDQLVINWHLTEACNYACRYCYSSWVKESHRSELFQSPQDSLSLLEKLYEFFRPDSASNPLHAVLDWKNLRLSLAGGETLLYPEHTRRIAQQAKDLGFKLSLITNASLLSRPGAADLIENLSILGISLDSGNLQTNRQIGRVDAFGLTLNLDDLATTVRSARSANPDLVIKINTVVNKYNAEENLNDLIMLLEPDKWKVLRALPIVNDDLVVSDEQFHTFVERHQPLGKVLFAEDNQDMTESYLMVDPYGRFFQNQSSHFGENPYIYSMPILQIGAEAAFRQVNFDVEKFSDRYSKSTREVTA